MWRSAAVWNESNDIEAAMNSSIGGRPLTIRGDDMHKAIINELEKRSNPTSRHRVVKKRSPEGNVSARAVL